MHQFTKKAIILATSTLAILALAIQTNLSPLALAADVITPPTTPPVTPPVEPSPTPSPVPSPTPPTTPVTPPTQDTPNPIIKTRRLPSGKKGRQYRAPIQVIQLGKDMQLGLTVEGLPEGISLQNCRQRSNHRKTILNCYLKGSTQHVGHFDVLVTATNSNNQSTQKSLDLQIKDNHRRWYWNWHRHFPWWK